MCYKINFRCINRLIMKIREKHTFFCQRSFDHLWRCLYHCLVVYINLYINLYIPLIVDSTTLRDSLNILSDVTIFLFSLIQFWHCKRKMFATMEVNNWTEIIQNALVNPATKETIAVK